MAKPYTSKSMLGPDTAAIGKWVISGPGIEPLHFTDRTMAKVVERALNLAHACGKRSVTIKSLDPCTHEYGTRGGICEACGAEV